jgi:SAM-dependent methyltransferase
LKNRSVILDGASIQLVDSIGELNDGIVMNEVAKPLTLEFCKVVGRSKGDILDIGFGLGFSANYFLELGVKSYTCIELNRDIYNKAVEWAKEKTNVTILLGDWIEIMPTLVQKYDGIFMDTYGDDLEKYAKFEQYAKDVAKEGCTLSIWEYPSIKALNKLNCVNIPVHQNNYRLLLRPFHKLCWTYYFAGEFRKELFYEKKNIISSDLCNEIISENADGYVLDQQTAVVEGIEHKRKVWIKDLKNNTSLFEIIRENFYPNHSAFRSEDLYFCKIIKYSQGCLHDRHLETDKYTHLLSEEQFVDSIVITLNSDFKGGSFKVFDSWTRSNRAIYSDTNTVQGDVIKFLPFQHCETSEVLEGTKYEIYIKLKRKELKIKHRVLI